MSKKVFASLRLCGLCLVVGWLSLASAGCGYALAGRGSFLPTDIRIVGIPQLVNRTTYFDVEQVLTERIRNEFIGRGKYRVVPEAGDSDAVLNAEIVSITLSPIGLTTGQLARA